MIWTFKNLPKYKITLAVRSQQQLQVISSLTEKGNNESGDGQATYSLVPGGAHPLEHPCRVESLLRTLPSMRLCR